MTIKIKLGLAFGAVALVTLVIAYTAWILYDRLSHTFQLVISQQVPVMTASLKLAKAGTVLAESALSLNKVSDENDLDKEILSYNKKAKQLQIALNNIPQTSFQDDTIIKRINQASKDLIENLRGIESLSKERLVLAIKKREAIEVFNEYQDNLANIALGGVSKATFTMQFRPAKAESEKETSLQISAQIIRLITHMNLSVMQAISQQSPSDIEYHHDKFILLSNNLEALVHGLKNNPIYTDLYLKVSQFIKYGRQEDNIFKLRIEELDVRDEGEILVEISQTHSKKMEKLLSSLVDSAWADIENVKKEAVITIQSGKHLIFYLSILSVLIAIIMGWVYVNRKLLQPIDVMLKGVKHISANHLSHRIVISSKDELGMLANAFNRMAERLQETISSLEQRTQAAEEAKIEAELANRTKSAFLANMSHELRTPLNGILGYAQVLNLDDSLTEEQQEGLHVIQSSGEHLLMLINDILDYSQLESEQASLFPADFDFHTFLSHVSEKARVLAQQKNISFVYCPLSYLPAGVHADEKRLRQVLMNLLGNAIKFTNQGKVVFKVGYHEHKIRFQVEDTGIGIEKTKLEAIFKPFQQGNDNYLTEKAEGTGIGLPLVKKIVDLMHGEFHIKSEPGRGCTVWIDLVLPDALGELVKDEIIDARTIIGYHRPSEENTISILIVDDKRENRQVLLNLLKPLGFYIIEASNGQEGLEQLKVVRPHLIFTDLVMPIMDGFEFVRQVRRNFAYNHTPIIALSASMFDIGRQKSLHIDCSDFAMKPFKPEEILKLLQKHLKIKWTYEEEARLLEPGQSSDMQPLQSIAHKEVLTDEEILEHCTLTSRQANVLYDLGMKGDVKGIEANIQQLLLNQPCLQPLADKIQAYLKNFDTDAICELVEKYVKS